MRELMVLTQWVNNWTTPLNALNMESEANFTSAESTYTFNFSMYLSGPTKTLHPAHVQSWHHNHDCLASHCSFSHPFTGFQCWLKTLVSLRVIIIKVQQLHSHVLPYRWKFLPGENFCLSRPLFSCMKILFCEFLWWPLSHFTEYFCNARVYSRAGWNLCPAKPFSFMVGVRGDNKIHIFLRTLALTLSHKY